MREMPVRGFWGAVGRLEAFGAMQRLLHGFWKSQRSQKGRYGLSAVLKRYPKRCINTFDGAGAAFGDVAVFQEEVPDGVFGGHAFSVKHGANRHGN
jgi:hypothetical protein